MSGIFWAPVRSAGGTADMDLPFYALNTANDGVQSATGDFAAAIASTKNIGLYKGTFLCTSNVTPARALWFWGGVLKPASGVTINLTGSTIVAPEDTQIFDLSAGGTFTGTMNLPVIYAAWFGTTVGALQVASNIAVASKADLCLAPGVTYTFGDTQWSLATGTNAMRIYSAGFSTLDVSGFTTAKPAIVWTGTPGFPTTTEIKSIRIIGSSVNAVRADGIELRDVTGCILNDIEGTYLNTMVRMHNTAAGHFTEECVLTNCRGDTTVKYGLEYKVSGGGDSSFHGSGMRGRNIFHPPIGGAAVMVGSGAQPYNAPLECTVFTTNTSGSSVLVENNSSNTKTIFKADIRIEGNSASPNLVAAINNTTYFVTPDPMSASGNLVRGTGVFCRRAMSNLGGSITTLGEFLLGRLDNFRSGQFISGVGGTHRLTVQFRNATGTYDKRYILIAGSNDFAATTTAGAGSRDFVGGTIIAVTQNVDTAGYGEITFSVHSSGNLVATQAGLPATGVTCYFEQEQIAQPLNNAFRINDFIGVYFADTDVALNPTNTITFASNHPWVNGCRVMFQTIAGSSITGLVDATVYYVKKTSATVITLAATSGGTDIPLTAKSSSALFRLIDR